MAEWPCAKFYARPFWCHFTHVISTRVTSAFEHRKPIQLFLQQMCVFSNRNNRCILSSQCSIPPIAAYIVRRNVRLSVRLLLPVSACYLPDLLGSGWFIEHRVFQLPVFACNNRQIRQIGNINHSSVARYTFYARSTFPSVNPAVNEHHAPISVE